MLTEKSTVGRWQVFASSFGKSDPKREFKHHYANFLTGTENSIEIGPNGFKKC